MLRSLDRQYQDQYRLRQRRRFAFKLSLVGGLLLAVLVATGYWLFWSGAFALQNLQIDNTSRIEQAELVTAVNDYLNERWLFVPRRNNILLLVDGDSLTGLLAAKFPEGKELSVRKDLPKAINISLRARDPLGGWCFKTGQCFLFDDSGWLMKEAGNAATKFWVEDRQTVEAVTVGGSLNPVLFNFIMAMVDGLAKQTIIVSRVILPSDDPFQAIFQTDESWRLITATNQPVSQQLNALAAVLEKKITAEQRLILQYIDVQLPSRVYYK